MRLLLVNPNTTVAVTERIAAAARGVAAVGTEIVTATAAFGAEVIGTRTEMAVGEHACVSVMAGHAGGCDGVIVGASLDSAVRAGRELLDVPVIGITEAALHTACLLGGRFGLVTLSARSAAVTREMVEGYGLLGRMAGMRWLRSAPADLMRDPDAAVGDLVAAGRALVEEELADVVVLVGAVMGGMPGRLQGAVPVPVIEGVSCAVGLMEGLVRLGVPKAQVGSFAGVGVRRLSGVDAGILGRFSGGLG